MKKYFANTIGLLLLLVLVNPTALAQLSYRKGQHVEPAYEGWRENADGTFSFLFGYFNENWEEEIDIPVGENNYFSPGDADQGQPSYFLPRRNRFTFEVRVPADWGDKELVWTVTSPNGVTRKAYAMLATDYTVDNIIIASETGSLGAGTSSPESRANTPPQPRLLGDRIRTAKVGEPISIRTQVVDDGIPRPGRVGSSTSFEPKSREQWIQDVLRPPRRSTVGKVNGLYLSWNKYRGPGEVSFSPEQVKPWEDTRASANSPWGALWAPPPIPEAGVYEITATFSEPGAYTLWGRADDGGLYGDTYITVNVTP